VSAAQPLVSICMPVFNAERWVGAALDSALRQTYTEFELIVADNASTDGTLEVVRSFDDSRVRIQTAPRTVGAVANHNRAIRLSSGAFVKFLHGDDLLLPDCLEAMVSLALEDDAIGLVLPRETCCWRKAPMRAGPSGTLARTNASSAWRGSTTAAMSSTNS
jgi:glycosyltransferase involved in cell wall biosynthesis